MKKVLLVVAMLIVLAVALSGCVKRTDAQIKSEASIHDENYKVRTVQMEDGTKCYTMHHNGHMAISCVPK